MSPGSEACLRYFRSNPAFRRVLLEVRKKYRSFGGPSGFVILRDATRAECEAMRGVFGRFFEPPLKFCTAEFEKKLRECSFEGVPLEDADLREVLEAFYGEKIQTTRERKQEKEDRFQTLLSSLDRKDTEPAALAWLEKLRDSRRSERQMLNRRLEEDPEGARAAMQLVLRCAGAIRENGGKGIRLALLSALVSTDPHAMDGGTLAGKLMTAMLADMAGEKNPENAEAREELYFRYGILSDSISSTVSQVGLILEEPAGEHPAWRVLRERREICTLTPANLNALSGARSPTGRVYLVENEMVFSQLCDHVSRFHSPLICTSGQLSVAAHRLLDLLAESGTELYYAGDFDGMGLTIASQLVERYPGQLRLWRMSEEDYRRCCSGKALTEKSLRLLENGTVRSNIPVSAAVHDRGLAGFQEGILEEMLADLTTPIAVP